MKETSRNKAQLHNRFKRHSHTTEKTDLGSVAQDISRTARIQFLFAIVLQVFVSH
jgi:hypothetical protein